MGLMDNIKRRRRWRIRSPQSGEGSDPVNKAYDIGVSVQLENGESYDTMVHQYLTDDAVNAYQPGGRFQIKADPDDTSKVMLYGQA